MTITIPCSKFTSRPVAHFNVRCYWVAPRLRGLFLRNGLSGFQGFSVTCLLPPHWRARTRFIPCPAAKELTSAVSNCQNLAPSLFVLSRSTPHLNKDICSLGLICHLYSIHPHQNLGLTPYVNPKFKMLGLILPTRWVHWDAPRSSVILTRVTPKLKSEGRFQAGSTCVSSQA